MQTASVLESVPFQRSHDDHTPLLACVRHRFGEVVGSGVPLFTTDAPWLWQQFIAALPEGLKPTYACRACQRFVETYGGLVAINERGVVAPAMWPVAGPGVFNEAIFTLHEAVGAAKVTGVFLATEKVWGLPQNHDKIRGCDWQHFAVTPPASMVRAWSVLKTSDQAMAEKLEDFKMLDRALAEFPIETAQKVHTLLTTGHLQRSEKCIGVAEWFLKLQQARAATKYDRRRENLTWKAVATAPAGFCHVRSGMIGTLLEDVQVGLDFAVIKARFDEKMHPLQYLRPQAPPSAGNIAQAEKVVQELRAAGALDRRFARIEDLETLWTPKAIPERLAKGGVFEHLTPAKTKGKVSDTDAPPVVMTWRKFQAQVLGTADRIEFLVPHGHNNYIAMTAAANPEAPPIIQWDSIEKRNTVAWYVYNGGTPPEHWGLASGQWCEVSALTLLPPMWHGGKAAHQGEGAILILKGARDLPHQRGGGMFVENLRSEFHGVRRTLEAYFLGAAIAGKEESSACGYDLRKGGQWNCTIRVTFNGIRTSYRLDRWD